MAMSFHQQQQFLQEQRGEQRVDYIRRNSSNNSNDNYSGPAAAATANSGVGREMAETGRITEGLKFESLRKAEALKAVSRDVGSGND